MPHCAPPKTTTQLNGLCAVCLVGLCGSEDKLLAAFAAPQKTAMLEDSGSGACARNPTNTNALLYICTERFKNPFVLRPLSIKKKAFRDALSEFESIITISLNIFS